MRLSVNIESAADLQASAASYFPTSQSIEFVRGVASAALDGGGAHALLGPYGVGKSSLAAFALNELAYPTSSFEPAAHSHLFGTTESPVADVLSAGGLAPMPVVGAPEPLASRVTLALQTLANNDSVLGAVPALDSYARLDPREATSDQALLMLTEAARAIKQQGKAGALLIIDEFGRHLEYMLSTSSDGDLHLLQDIAEATGRADSPISLVIVQHLGLEHYGSMLHGSRRYEWDKVRGRFFETVLSHTETDAAHIVAKVLDALGGEVGPRPALRLPKTVPRILKDPGFLAAAHECRPLHPVTVILLSRLAKVLGQNDRTMVGWLTSDLDNGFRALRKKVRKNGWLYPHMLYDHFFRDALWAPPNPVFAKRFAATHTAHERMDDDLSVDARLLFRTLALLSFCAGSGLRSDRSSALACLPRGFRFDRAISELTSRSLVLYRHYRGEYVVWEGSDYDVARHVDEELSRLSLDVAAEMNRRCRAPVLAHGHLIRTGNRRTAPVLWLNDDEEPPEANGEPRVLVWLADNVPGVTTKDVVGTATSKALEPHLRESAAIHRLLDKDAALQEDAIAVKELKSRRAFHEERIASVRQELLESDLDWRVGGDRFETMQGALSRAMDTVFFRTFNLHNELVNRDGVSAPVAFALRKLIGLLYGCLGQENLGIEKFPAERIIHESLLKRTGLYTRTGDGEWHLRLDGNDLTPGLAECIGEARRLFADGQPSTAPSLLDVANQLAGPPYGVKRTPAVLLCILILLDDKGAHELYEEGRFLPHWGPDTLIRALRTPKRFTIVAASASPVGREFLGQYKKALGGASNSNAKDVTPVALARDVLRRHARLSPYAQRTDTVSDRARAFRRALEIADSPGDMLFRRIPGALGHPSLPVQTPARKGYLKVLRTVWRELEEADEALMVRLEGVVLDALDCSALEPARLLCQDYVKSLLAHGGMHHGYESFLSRICDDTLADHRDWLAKVVDGGLGIATPMASWSDAHASQGEFLLRRNFVALRQARNLLAECKVEHDASPFAIVWPNPDVAMPSNAREVAEKIASLADNLPPKERTAVIVALATTNRRTK